jgi:hypothetical protein
MWLGKEGDVALSLTHAESLAYVDSSAILRALASRSFRTNTQNIDVIKKLNAANEEMDRAGDVGLTVSCSEVKLLKHAEGVWGEWFGASGEFYILTTAIDGSGRPFDYKTQFFQGIRRNDQLPLGSGGMLVTYMTKPKWFIDLHMLVMESDSDLRDLGRSMEEAKKEARLDSILQAAGSAAAFDPALISQVVSGVDLFLNALTYFLKANGDDHVATVHDFYLKHQAFGKGRHPERDRKRFQGVEVAYIIELTEL